MIFGIPVRLRRGGCQDKTIISFAVSLFCTLKTIPIKGLTNGSYRRTGFNEAQPDLSFYLDRNADIVPLGTTVIDLNLYSAPDLVIEIANQSLADDKGEKRLLYEDLGIQKYWIVDVKNTRILAFQMIEEGSRRIQTSQVLPNLQIETLQTALQHSRQMNQGQVFAWLMEQFQAVNQE